MGDLVRQFYTGVKSRRCETSSSRSSKTESDPISCAGRGHVRNHNVAVRRMIVMSVSGPRGRDVHACVPMTGHVLTPAPPFVAGGVSRLFQDRVASRSDTSTRPEYLAACFGEVDSGLRWWTASDMACYRQIGLIPVHAAVVSGEAGGMRDGDRQPSAQRPWKIRVCML